MDANLISLAPLDDDDVLNRFDLISALNVEPYVRDQCLAYRYAIGGNERSLDDDTSSTGRAGCSADNLLLDLMAMLRSIKDESILRGLYALIKAYLQASEDEPINEFHSALVCLTDQSVWLGFDEPSPLTLDETNPRRVTQALTDIVPAVELIAKQIATVNRNLDLFENGTEAKLFRQEKNRLADLLDDITAINPPARTATAIAPAAEASTMALPTAATTRSETYGYDGRADDDTAPIFAQEANRLRVILATMQDEGSQATADCLLSILKPGHLVEGVVTAITDSAASIDLGNVEALLPLNELTWNHPEHPEALIQVGERIVPVLVTDVDKDRRQIQLSTRRLADNPYTRFPLGSKIQGVIKEIGARGARVALNKSPAEGLIPISDLAYPQCEPRALRAGDHVTAYVVCFDHKEELLRLRLSPVS